jgi:hypothetical protein
MGVERRWKRVVTYFKVRTIRMFIMDSNVGVEWSELLIHFLEASASNSDADTRYPD